MGNLARLKQSVFGRAWAIRQNQRRSVWMVRVDRNMNRKMQNIIGIQRLRFQLFLRSFTVQQQGATRESRRRIHQLSSRAGQRPKLRRSFRIEQSGPEPDFNTPTKRSEEHTSELQ